VGWGRADWQFVEPWQEARYTDKREGKISRGWRLTQVAWTLIRKDGTMLGLALAGIFSATAFSLLFVFLAAQASGGNRSSGLLSLLGFAALYIATLASVFFNVALACAASAAFDGEQMGAREAVRMAWGKRKRIALWALISALVGTLIAEIANRLPGGAKIVAWLFGAAWGLATFFVIPILAMEGVGAGAALKRSSGLVKRRWGEGVSGRISIGAWAVIAMVPLAIGLAIGATLMQRHPEAGIVVIGFSLVGMVAVFAAVAATQQVFAVALYRYAIDAPIGGFSASDLEYPFTDDPARKKRKSWILRIGGPILGLLVLLIVIGISVGPRHHTGAQGYFHIDYTPSQAAGLSSGSPIVFHHRQVGSVTSTEIEGTTVKVEFRTDPGLRYIVETTPAYVDHFRGQAYMRIGGRPPRPPAQPSRSL
jgi:Family of unknown function (DUF6159)